MKIRVRVLLYSILWSLLPPEVYAADLLSSIQATERQFSDNCTAGATAGVYGAPGTVGMFLPELHGSDLQLLERLRLKELLAETCLPEILMDPDTRQDPGGLLFGKFVVVVEGSLLSFAKSPGTTITISLYQTDTMRLLYNESVQVTPYNYIAVLGAFFEKAAAEIQKATAENNYNCDDLADDFLETQPDLQGCVRVRLAIDMEFRNTSGCNFDNHQTDIVFSVTPAQTADKGIAGFGLGTVVHTPVNRCPDTMYGGIRTLNTPFPVRVESYQDAAGQTHVLLTPHDLVENYYTSGTAYFSGSLHQPVFAGSKENSGAGTLLDFVLPDKVKELGSYTFTVRTPPRGGGWVEGTATFELL